MLQKEERKEKIVNLYFVLVHAFVSWAVCLLVSFRVNFCKSVPAKWMLASRLLAKALEQSSLSRSHRSTLTVSHKIDNVLTSMQ